MKARKQIKIKIKEYVRRNNIMPKLKSRIPIIYQQNILDDGVDENMIDNIIYDLVGEEDALVDLLGKELYESHDFQIYYKTIKTIKDKSTR